MNSRGVTLVELLISTMMLSILMLALANFSLDILNVTDKHAQGLEKVTHNRITNERILEQLHSAEYIFPKGITFNVSSDSMEDGLWNNSNETINTNNNIAMLVSTNIEDEYGYSEEGSKCYNLVAYYTKIEEGDYESLYEFSTTWPSFCWTENTIPNINNAQGTSTLLSDKIQANSVDLSLILSQETSSMDAILKSERQGANENSTNALIKGIELFYTQDTPGGETDITITGLSRKIPRYSDDVEL